MLILPILFTRLIAKYAASGSTAVTTNLVLMTCNGIRCIYWQFVPPQALNPNDMQASDIFDTIITAQTVNNNRKYVVHVCFHLCEKQRLRIGVRVRVSETYSFRLNLLISSDNKYAKTNESGKCHNS